MQCPQCGFVRDPFDPNCPRCARLGAPRPAPAPAQQPAGPWPNQPPSAAHLPPPSLNGCCPNCRRAVGVGATICGYCRYDARMGSVPPPEPEPKRTGAYAIHPGVVIVILSVALIGVAIQWGPMMLAVGTAFLPSAGTRGRSSGSTGGGLPNFVLLQPGPKGVTGAITGTPLSTDQITERLVTASASTGGDLEFALAWDSITDLDIEVKTPGGAIINAHAPVSQDGGEQDVDANPTPLTEEGERRLNAGQVVGEENVIPIKQLFADIDEKVGRSGGIPGVTRSSEAGKATGRITRKPVEHVFFARAPKGIYTVSVSCYSWQEKNRDPLPYSVEIRSQGKIAHQVRGVIGPESFVSRKEPPVQVCQFMLR